MKTRSLVLRPGRIAVSRPSTHSSIRQWRRSITSTARRLQQPPPSTPANEEYDSISADWHFYQHQRALTRIVGAKVEPHYRPNSLLRDPPRPEDITLELLLASQTHLGHRTSLWHPANSRYIHGVWGQVHDAIHVISLDATAAHLRRACKVVEGVAARGGLILFVGTRDGQSQAVVRAAELAGGCHLFDKWIPGTLTNAEQILGKCKKKVVNEKDEEVLGFDDQLSTRAAIKPDLVVCLNPLENYILLHECGLHAIPTIGIIDTDANPTWVTYPIPANDDSLRSVTVIAGALGRAGEAGQASRLKRAAAGLIDFTPAANLRMPTQDELFAARRRRELLVNENFDDDDQAVLTLAEEDLEEPVVIDERVIDQSELNASSDAQEELIRDQDLLEQLPEEVISDELSQNEIDLLSAANSKSMDDDLPDAAIDDFEDHAGPQTSNDPDAARHAVVSREANDVIDNVDILANPGSSEVADAVDVEDADLAREREDAIVAAYAKLMHSSEEAEEALAEQKQTISKQQEDKEPKQAISEQQEEKSAAPEQQEEDSAAPEQHKKPDA